MPFLSLETVRLWERLARRWGVSEVARSRRGFLTAYKRAGGRLSALPCEWRDERWRFFQRKLAERDPLWRPNGLPTRHGISLVMWAGHPDPQRLRRAYALYEAMEREGTVPGR